jgi:hypothetical protein
VCVGAAVIVTAAAIEALSKTLGKVRPTHCFVLVLGFDVADRPVIVICVIRACWMWPRSLPWAIASWSPTQVRSCVSPGRIAFESHNALNKPERC